MTDGFHSPLTPAQYDRLVAVDARLRALLAWTISNQTLDPEDADWDVAHQHVIEELEWCLDPGSVEPPTPGVTP